MSNVYSLHIGRLIKLSLPTFLRKPKTLAFLNALFKPMLSQYNAFVAYKDDAIYRVSHNGSVTLLQKVLNDAFDDSQRRIYINNVQRRDTLRLYSREFERDIGTFTDAKFGFRSALEFDNTQADFTVHIPIEYQPDTELELNKYLIKVGAIINYYKIYGKNYNIVWID